MAKERILLAYSGGLDTSVIIPWLKENYDCDVIACCGDVGVGVDADFLRNKAVNCGAETCYVEDITEEFIKDFIYPTLKAQAVYERSYLLGTSFARPLIAKKLVEIARKENCTAICHGCTGKGNDQVRFELAVKALAPDLKIIAPWREWEIKSREQELAYAEARGIPVPVTKEENYSKDQNIWHLSHEGMDLEDPANEPNYDRILELMTSPEKAPDQPVYVTLTFEKGIPVKVDDVTGDVAMLEYLNKVAGENGVGIEDLVENRLVGMKSRGVYETPGGTVYYKAHRWLEQLCLEKDTMHFKDHVSLRYAELVYNGQWFHPLREALAAFVDKTQKTVSGTVKVKLYKGNVFPAGVTSTFSLHDQEIASFGEENVYDQKDAGGFINLFGLPTKVYASMKQRNNLD